MKYQTIPAILGLAMLLINSSLSQEANPADPGNNAGIQQALNAANASEIFSVSRNGAAVTGTVKIDFTPCKHVQFLRNLTGVPTRRDLVVRINSGVLTFDDMLPDAKPYWYWLQVVPLKGEPQTFGPIRVAPDTGNTGNYVNVANTYKWTVARTYQNASVTWNFPGSNLKSIEILRKTSITNFGKRNSILATLESTGDIADTLPAPEADYWYWIEATLVNGRIITQGPVKAEFSEN